MDSQITGAEAPAKRVLVAGLAAIDFTFAVESFPHGDAKFQAPDAQIIGGGGAANASVAISRLGGHAILAARVGEDQIADMIVDDLRAEGVDLDRLQRTPGGRSSFSSVFVDRDGARQILNFRGSGLVEDTGWMRDGPAPDAVLTDPRWPDGALAVLSLARELGVPGVLDGETPIDLRLLQVASHVAFSTQGLASLNPDPDPARALAALAPEIPGWACVTAGDKGVFYTAAGGDIAHIPAFPVAVRDTLGAGDVWHGAFTLELARGSDEEAAIVFANAAAGLKCQTFGGRAGSPSRAATLAFLHENSGGQV